MREEMEYISGVLDELEAVVQDASGVPMRKGRAIVDRSDLLSMLDDLRRSLPRELTEAEAVRRECEAIIAEAQEEARRKVQGAHERAEYLIQETEPYRRAQRRSAEIMDRAERYAEEISSGSEVYRDRVMDQLESWFQDSIVSVGESRQELNGSSNARRQRRDEDSRNGEDEGHGYHASSA